MKKLLAGVLVGALFLGSLSGCAGKREEEPEVPPLPDAEGEELDLIRGDTSFEWITEHISLEMPGHLIITRPARDISLQDSTYYITGCSDPDQELLLNGEPVEHVGHFGSFGVFVELEEGENIFTLSQGETSETVTITRGDEEVITTDAMTQLYPSGNTAMRSGESYTLRCVAPAGARVSAQVGDEIVVLSQNVATAMDGVPATYSASWTAGDVSGTVMVGTVAYILDWQGEQTTMQSAGRLFAVGRGDDLVVRAVDTASVTFVEADMNSDYYSTIRRDAVDRVVEASGDMYRLAGGGWIYRDWVEPVEGTPDYHNTVQEVVYTVEDTRETLTLKGTLLPPVHVERGEGKLRLTLANTSGVSGVELGDSALFSTVQVAAQEESTVVAFLLQDTAVLAGCLVSYTGHDTVITFKHAPVLEDGELPLQGITILLDAGHGGTDPGASSVARDDGPQEKDITLPTTMAVAKYLYALGADVRVTRTGDETLSLDDRQEAGHQPDIDLMLSLHCNSILYSYDGTGPSGVEVFYYDDMALPLAQALVDSICGKTGRVVRGAKEGHYKVAINEGAPSVLVEMGFLTNPAEYDNLCDPEQIYTVCEAIAEAVMVFVSPETAQEQLDEVQMAQQDEV